MRSGQKPTNQAKSVKLVGLFLVASSHNWVKDKKKTYEKALMQWNSR